jgi:hypothetical protein
MKKLILDLKANDYIIKLIIDNDIIVIDNIKSKKIAYFISDEKSLNNTSIINSDILTNIEVRVFRISKDKLKGMI